MTKEVPENYRFDCEYCGSKTEQGTLPEMLLIYPLNGEVPEPLNCCGLCSKKIKAYNELCETWKAQCDRADHFGEPQPEMPKELRELKRDVKTPEKTPEAPAQTLQQQDAMMQALMTIAQGQQAILAALTAPVVAARKPAPKKPAAKKAAPKKVAPKKNAPKRASRSKS